MAKDYLLAHLQGIKADLGRIEEKLDKHLENPGAHGVIAKTGLMQNLAAWSALALHALNFTSPHKP